MAQYDLDLSFDGALYALEAPTTDALERMRNRFRVQFMSLRQSTGRGSTFYSQLLQGLIRTNSDIVSLFSLTAAEIIIKMRQLQQDIYPNRAVLNDFEFASSQSITLYFTLFTSEGSIQDSVEVTA